jgi:hypothetical protein
MKQGQLIENLAVQLSDFDKEDAGNSYVHWSKELLQSYVNDAYRMIAELKPEKFISTRIVKLQPGTTQNTCCSLVGAITEYTDSTGMFISRINAIKAPPTWRGAACPTGAYAPMSVYRVTADPTAFEIYPPVPATGSYHVKLRCTMPPDEITSATLAEELPKGEFTAAVTEWALFRALSGDNDTSMGNLAQVHYKAWQDIIGAQDKVAKAFSMAGTK